MMKREMEWRRGQAGQRVAGEPARVLQLVLIDHHVAAGVGGHEADHHLARERPVLAADVADVRHVDAGLFLDLARHARLQRLAVVHEARDERVAPRRPVGLAGQQHAVAVAHEHDGGRVQVRVVLVAAARAAACPTRSRCVWWRLPQRGQRPLVDSHQRACMAMPPSDSSAIGQACAAHRDHRLARQPGRRRGLRRRPAPPSTARRDRCRARTARRRRAEPGSRQWAAGSCRRRGRRAGSAPARESSGRACSSGLSPRLAGENSTPRMSRLNGRCTVSGVVMTTTDRRAACPCWASR